MRRISLLTCVLFFLVTTGYAQISYGGKPLPLAVTRSSDNILFEEMPAFDVEEELRIDSLNESDLRSSYRFAYKFMTNYNRSNSGASFTLPDGTRVWRLGIRSRGALSINVLFSEFELPQGAKLFLYNSDQSHIRGSFTYLNNSDLQIFPVSPVEGEELIIEYQEPANVPFSGRLTIGEVNHAYRAVPGREPEGDFSVLYCMQSLSCFPDDPVLTPELGRSVVLLIIDGVTSCSGVMVNNTAKDGKPYLLTASHCINNDFKITEPEGFAKVAESIICFFNYDSPLCSPVIRGTEELSMVSTTYRALNEKHDMALLELKETPPAYYQPYYAGWDLSEEQESTFFSIHHPRGSLKRVNWLDGNVELTSFVISQMDFEKDAHWFVSRWTSGSTAPGSSGSPLFNMQGRIIGALSGGYSECRNPKNDYYFALSKTWEPEDDRSRQLKYWLNPTNKPGLVCDGMNPYDDTSNCIRLSNIRTNGNVNDTEVATVNGSDIIPLFGNNTLDMSEFAEEYYTAKPTSVYGAYLVTPSVGMKYDGLDVEVRVYSGSNGPETLIHSEVFQPKYWNKAGNSFQETEKLLSRAQESFIRFEKPVKVEGTFYVGYRIKSAPDDTYFSALNLKKNTTIQNTTWILTEDKWIKASNYPEYGFNTSLYVDPVIQSATDVGNLPIVSSENVQIIKAFDGRMLSIILPDGVKKGNFSLISINGKIMKENTLSDNQSTLSLPLNLIGIYLVKVTYESTQFVQKILF